MKYILLLLFISVFLLSCNKEKQYNPDEHIVYCKWYQLSRGKSDTLFAVYIPNAFVPTGDGVNDTFNPRLNTYNNYGFSYSLEIVNKNNNIVFKTNDHNEDWDGSLNGHIQPIGTYTYKFTIAHNLDNYEYSGNVLLIN